MRTAYFKILFALIFHALFIQAAVAAPKDKLPIPGKFLPPRALSPAEAKTTCAVDPGSEIATSDSCAVLKFEFLGKAGNEELFFAWYRRTGKEPSEQLVLFSAPDAASPLTPVWTDVVDAFESTEPITGAALRRGPLGDILELKYSTGGSAGVWSEYFVRREKGWQYLQQAQLDEDALNCLPKDYGIQSRTVDLENAVVELFAPTADDPQCCPSGIIYLKLKLAGDSLRGDHCRFEKK